MMKEKKKTKNQNPPSMVVSPRWGVARVCETITAEVNNQNNKGVTMDYNNENNNETQKRTDRQNRGRTEGKNLHPSCTFHNDFL